MQSHTIRFVGKDHVEVAVEEVREPGPGDVLLKATNTLISTGTEGIILSRLFEAGSHWDRWVTYPFHPGYSMVGRILAVGKQVEGIHEGDRFAVRKPHQQYVTVAFKSQESDNAMRAALTHELYPVPEGISDEEAPWFGMATIGYCQLGNRAEHCAKIAA